MIRKARAVWRGSGRAGNGDLSTDSGVLANTPYSFRTRFENEQGTNPEELIAAAHAGCFTMALAFRLQAAQYTPTELNTEAAVTFEQDKEGFRITRSALTLRASVPNLDQDTFDRLARAELSGFQGAPGRDHTGREAGLNVNRQMRHEIADGGYSSERDIGLLPPRHREPGHSAAAEDRATTWGLWHSLIARIGEII
jgi:osmotically inducible protein OsmC